MSSIEELAGALIAQSADADDPTHASSVDDALCAALQQTLTTARAAWPDVQLSDEQFIAHLARHRSGAATPASTLADWLTRVRTSDLFLACACAANTAGAIAAFERAYMPKIRRVLERERNAQATLDERQQRMREKLFVGNAKIADYSGRGTLEKWLEVVVLRMAIDLSRERREIIGETLDSTDGVSLPDPELQFIKVQYREQFKAAFNGALERLSADKRNLLRLHYVDGVTLEQLATLTHLHRSTVAERLANARKLILENAQHLLAEALKLAPAEVASLLLVMRSQLELSLSLLLSKSALP